MEIKIRTPQNFNFKRTVISHGWYGLLPFSLDSEKWLLTRVIDLDPKPPVLDPKPPVTIVMAGRKGHVRVTTSRSFHERETAKVTRDARHMLRLDDDLEPFYLATETDSEFGWIATQGAG